MSLRRHIITPDSDDTDDTEPDNIVIVSEALIKEYQALNEKIDNAIARIKKKKKIELQTSNDFIK